MRAWAIILGVLLFGGVARAAEAPVRYQLTPVVVNGALTALSVKLDFKGDPDGETGLDLPDHWAEAENLSRLMSRIEVKGGTLEPGDGPVRRLRHRPGAELEVSYQIAVIGDADPGRDHLKGEPVVRPTWFMAHGEGVFATPSGRQAAPARFAWGARPAGWTLASDLDHLARRPGRVSDIVDSVVVGGEHLSVVERHLGRAPLRVAVLGQWPSAPEALADMAARIMTAETAFWRDAPSPFLITLTPLSGGQGGSYSTTGTGKGDAFAIESTTNRDPARDPHFLAHEYMHTWIANQVGGLSELDEARDYWFSEGFTDFYASRILLRAGIWSLEDYAGRYNEVLARYAGSPARNFTADQVMAAFWTNQNAQQSPYDRGRLLAVIWDKAVRSASGGRLSLDDVMRRQLAAVRTGGAKGTGASLFPSMVSATAPGLAVEADLARHVTRGDTVRLPSDVFGACLKVSDVTIPVFDRGFDGETSAKTGVISGVDPAGPAYAAGLRDGMKRLGRVGGQEGDSRVAIAYRVAAADGGEQVIQYLPAGRATFQLQTVSVPPGLSPEQRAACVRDLGGT
jgi:predicted metalloprotease with PDZ domain